MNKTKNTRDMNRTLGETAYNAYCESRGWKAFNGDSLPSYQSMKSDPKRADLIPSWEAAAKAVADEIALVTGRG